MSEYTAGDFSESLERSQYKEQVTAVLASWGESGAASEWAGGFVCSLANGKFLYLSGWCDTSGWGCQDGIDEVIFDDAPNPDLLAKDKTWDWYPTDLNKWLAERSKAETKDLTSKIAKRLTEKKNAAIDAEVTKILEQQGIAAPTKVVPAPRLWGQVQAHIDDLRAIASDLKSECMVLFETIADQSEPDACTRCGKFAVLQYSNQSSRLCGSCCGNMLKQIDDAGGRVSGRLNEGEIDLRDAFESLYDVCTGEADIWLPLRRPDEPLPIILSGSPGVGKSDILGGE